jgi:ribosomal protein L25 (general stress protein Ctc)
MKTIEVPVVERSKKPLHISNNINLVPGIVYSKDKNNLKFSLPLVAIEKLTDDVNFMTRVFTLQVHPESLSADILNQKAFAEAKHKHVKSVDVVVADITFHPVTDKVMHIDFKEVSKGDIVKIKVPVLVKNKETSTIIKLGGQIHILNYAPTIMCKVENIPTHVEYDALDLAVGNIYKLSQGKFDGDFKIIKDIDMLRVVGKRGSDANATADATAEKK